MRTRFLDSEGVLRQSLHADRKFQRRDRDRFCSQYRGDIGKVKDSDVASTTHPPSNLSLLRTAEEKGREEDESAVPISFLFLTAQRRSLSRE